MCPPSFHVCRGRFRSERSHEGAHPSSGRRRFRAHAEADPLILERDPDIEVVGTAMDGAFALRKIEELHPHVVTLDLEMPRMDGLETLRMIMRSAPLPVIVFSTHSKEGAYSTFKALALGAIDFVPSRRMPRVAVSKPSPLNSSKKSKLPNAQWVKIYSQSSIGAAASGQTVWSCSPSAQANHCDWNFHWRPQRAPIFTLPNSRGLSIHVRCRAAHARRLHRNVCPSPG